MQMLIGGLWADASDQKTFPVLNPATQVVLDTVPMATFEDVDKALKNAREGAKVWGGKPLYERLDILHEFLRRFPPARTSWWT